MTKPRVQIDAFVIGSFMVGTAVLFFIFPYLYNDNQTVRNICAVIGFVLIVFGALLRMSARGHKKYCSNQGYALVTDGPYKFVRNPMYLGTFLICVGFIFPLFPLWTIAIFSTVFYLRFIVQIKKEEETLLGKFGTAYRDYCQKVSVFIPTVKSFTHVAWSEVFPWKHLWSTKEKYSLFYWPVINLFFWFLHQEFFWHERTIVPLIANGIFVVGLGLWMVIHASQENRWIIPEKS